MELDTAPKHDARKVLTRIASNTKKFQPAAKPIASSMYRLANLMKGEEIGRYVTISAVPGAPSQHIEEG
jgi:hypothetical protein